jgi:hypothetical protein
MPIITYTIITLSGEVKHQGLIIGKLVKKRDAEKGEDEDTTSESLVDLSWSTIWYRTVIGALSSFTTYLGSVPIGHAMILSRRHASGYDVPVLSSLKVAAVGGAIVSGFIHPTAIMAIINLKRHSHLLKDPYKPPSARIVLLVILFSFVASIIAAMIGVAIFQHIPYLC